MTPRRRTPPAAGLALAAVGIGLSGVLAACAPQDGLAAAGTPVPGPPSATSSPPVSGPAAPSAAPSAAVSAAGLDPCPPSDPDVPARPDGLPDLTLPCLGDGPAVRLAGLRGTPAVVNVWASWCQPCQQELPVIADVAAEAGDRVRVLGIDLLDSPEAALALAAETGARFPSVRDDDGAVRAALRPPLAGPPRTYFVRPDGSIAARVDGAIDDTARLRALIAEHLGVTV